MRFLGEGVLGGAGAQVGFIRGGDKLVEFEAELDLVKLLFVFGGTVAAVQVRGVFILVRQAAHFLWEGG